MGIPGLNCFKLCTSTSKQFSPKKNKKIVLVNSNTKKRDAYESRLAAAQLFCYHFNFKKNKIKTQNLHLDSWVISPDQLSQH